VEQFGQSDSPSNSQRNIGHLVEGAKDILSATKEWIEKAAVADWNPSDATSISFYHLVVRAIVVKQSESLRSILSLEQCSEGFSAVPLLRAMCEEMIWTKYLASRDQNEAAQIVEALGPVGIHQTFLAQEGYKIPNLGFSEQWKALSADAHARGSAALERLFRSHGFKLRGNQVTPSMSQLAKSVAMQDIYDFLYHATSRAVHFSVPELLRRIWGRPGAVRISSETFERYWAAFAIYWGSWLYALTFVRVLPLLETPDFDENLIEEMRVAIDRLQAHGAIPILTNQEVFWPDKWR
jgi:hypothetical protein